MILAPLLIFEGLSGASSLVTLAAFPGSFQAGLTDCSHSANQRGSPQHSCLQPKLPTWALPGPGLMPREAICSLRVALVSRLSAS